MIHAESSGRLIIVDPSLIGNHDQHYVKTSCIAERAKESGAEVVVFANRSYGSGELVDGVKVIPVFNMTAHDYFKSIGKGGRASLGQSLKDVIRTYFPEQLVHSLKRLRNKLEIILSRAGISVTLIPDLGSSGVEVELRAAMLEAGVSSSDYLMVHTSDAITYRMILRLLLSVYPLGPYPCIHICTPYEEHEMPFMGNGMSVSRVVNYLKLLGFLNRNVFLYAEKGEVARSLSRSWGVGVTDLGLLPEQSDAAISSDSLFVSGHITFADRLLTEVEGVSKTSARQERDGAHVRHSDVRIKSGYNEGLCEAEVSDDGHPLFVKQIVP